MYLLLGVRIWLDGFPVCKLYTFFCIPERSGKTFDESGELFIGVISMRNSATQARRPATCPANEEPEKGMYIETRAAE